MTHRLPHGLPLRFLTAVVLFASMAGVAVGRWTAPGVPPLATAADSSRLQPLARRVAQLERLLGDSVSAADLDAPGRLATDYARLSRRLDSLARLGDVTWARVPSLFPVTGGTITSPYTAHRFHPILHEVRAHLGLDIGAPMGAPIRATADGVVLGVGSSATYGLGVDIDHGNGFITRYAHASRILVRTGMTVRRGDVIAYVGATGMATGPHLHYEIFRNGWSVDPLPFLLDPTARIDALSGLTQD